eukprot:gene10407-22488_t
MGILNYGTEQDLCSDNPKGFYRRGEAQFHLEKYGDALDAYFSAR